MRKRTLYLLGLVTLLVFPVPTFIGLYFLEGTHPLEILEPDQLTLTHVLTGLELGAAYALLALALMQAPVFRSMPSPVEQMVKNMKLSLWDCFFLSVCAGVGEELLFRSGVQVYLGPILTSVVFVAIHGYLNPVNWRMSLYGVIVLPFILLISYGLPVWGIWFCIAAHFAYDFVLFLVMSFTCEEEDED